MSRLTCNKELLEYELFSSQTGLIAFSTTRKGGCSKGAYATFNCSPYSGDDSAAVLQNLQHLGTLLPTFPVDWVIPHQVHGTSVLDVGQEYADALQDTRREMLEGVDALVTDRPGYCICVSTADCIPLLFYDIQRRVVAVAHAGWRGTVNRIAEKTLNHLEHWYGSRPEDVCVAIEWEWRCMKRFLRRVSRWTRWPVGIGLQPAGTSTFGRPIIGCCARQESCASILRSPAYVPICSVMISFQPVVWAFTPDALCRASCWTFKQR